MSSQYTMRYPGVPVPATISKSFKTLELTLPDYLLLVRALDVYRDHLHRSHLNQAARGRIEQACRMLERLEKEIER